MSGDDHEFINPNDPLYYAPRAMRDRARDSEAIPTDFRYSRNVGSLSDEMSSRYDDLRDLPWQDRSDAFANAVAQALEDTRQAERVEAPPVLRQKSRSPMRIIVRLAIAVALATAIIAPFVLLGPGSSEQSDGATAAISSIVQSLKASLFPAPPPRRTPPTLAVQDGSGIVNEPLKLGVSVTSPPPEASVTIKGLPAGARLTFGKRMATNEWRVATSEIANTSVIPPDEFVGQANLTAELRDADGITLVKGAMRLAWAPVWRPGAAAVDIHAPPTALRPVESSVRAITPAEINGFIQRGAELLESGDLLAARLLFQRAADARDPRAALALGKTYDPLFLKQFGAGGPIADREQARHWYQKSKEWGDPTAQIQLDALSAAR